MKKLINAGYAILFAFSILVLVVLYLAEEKKSVLKAVQYVALEPSSVCQAVGERVVGVTGLAEKKAKLVRTYTVTGLCVITVEDFGRLPRRPPPYSWTLGYTMEGGERQESGAIVVLRVGAGPSVSWGKVSPIQATWRGMEGYYDGRFIKAVEDARKKPDPPPPQQERRKVKKKAGG